MLGESCRDLVTEGVCKPFEDNLAACPSPAPCVSNQFQIADAFTYLIRLCGP
jgi:hypothetical protein